MKPLTALSCCGFCNHKMAVNFTKETGRIGSSRSRKPELTNLMYGKLPPQARELEEAVLGAIMLEGDKLSDVLEILPTAECFYVEAHKKIYSAVQGLSEKGQAVDMLTVCEELNQRGELEIVGGQYAITKLTMAVVSSAHVIAHSRIVLEKFILRELIRICGGILTDAYEDGAGVFDLLDNAESKLFEISNNYLRKNYSSLQDVIVDAIEQIAKSKEQKDDLTGVRSGFPTLDGITAGWQKTDLIILAARPSVGKTAFALNLALNAAINPQKPQGVAIFSLEMSNVQLVKRMLSTVTDVPLEKITHGHLEDYEFTQITQRMEKLANAPIFIDDQAGLNIFELRAKCRRLKAKHDIQLIIIDYLQLMHGGTDSKFGNREQEISKISRELKGLAKELDIPIIALSQLSRAVETRSDKNKIPQLSDLRESGAIEQDADMVMFIYRPEYHGIENDEQGEPLEGETHINIAKHRNGRLGSVKLQAQLAYQRFVEIPENDFGGNPFAGMRKGLPGMDSGMSIAPGAFQTMQSKANDMTFDDDWDDETGGGGFSSKFKNPPPEDNDAPF